MKKTWIILLVAVALAIWWLFLRKGQAAKSMIDALLSATTTGELDILKGQIYEKWVAGELTDVEYRYLFYAGYLRRLYYICLKAMNKNYRGFWTETAGMTPTSYYDPSYIYDKYDV